MVRTPLNILVAVSGGVAAVKIPQLIRGFRKKGDSVRVVLTANAARFVTPLAFEAVADGPVYDDMFARRDSFTHISLRQWADCIVIAPATANVIAKIAAGIADDLVTTVALGASGAGLPRFVCPAMNDAMWRAPATARNCAVLAADGWTILGPGTGELACGDSGPGRMLEPDDIVRAVRDRRESLLPGKVIVTAGATRQALDAVRFVSNHSTGKMGIAIARALRERFSDVVLVHAALSEPLPEGIRCRAALSAEAMLAALDEELDGARALVMCAAVSDYTPKTVYEGKLKKSGSEAIVVEMVRTPDILGATADKRREQGIYTVGFAMETENLEGYARTKLEGKVIDAIVANPLDEPDAGFGSETNRAIFLTARGGREEWPLESKTAMAGRIAEHVAAAVEPAGGG